MVLYNGKRFNHSNIKLRSYFITHIKMLVLSKAKTVKYITRTNLGKLSHGYLVKISIVVNFFKTSVRAVYVLFCLSSSSSELGWILSALSISACIALI